MGGGNESAQVVVAQDVEVVPERLDLVTDDSSEERLALEGCQGYGIGSRVGVIISR
jgi:hypothetical protein